MMNKKDQDNRENIPIFPCSSNGIEKIPEDPQQDKYSKHGLTIPSSTMLVIGELTGAGLLALPKTIENAGVTGIVFLFVGALFLTYTGTILAECWNLIRQRYPEYKGHVRYPYPVIGEMTYGRPGRILTSSMMFGIVYSALIVYIILVTNNTGELLNELGLDMRYSYRLLIAGGIILPITWLGTPKDFWWVGIAASVTPMVSAILIVASISSDAAKQTGSVEHSSPSLNSITLSFGSVIWAFGGHFTYPTIQVDSANPDKFHYSVILGEVGAASLYIPVVISSYFVRGIHTEENILASISPGPMLYITQILMTLHFLVAIIVVANPVYQEVEELFRVPKAFTWRRCLVRSVLLASVVAIALLVPRFSLVMSLVGGTAMGLLAAVLPTIFYWKILTMEGSWKMIKISLGRKIAYSSVILFGAGCCGASTVSSLYSLVHESENNYTSHY